MRPMVILGMALALVSCKDTAPAETAAVQGALPSDAEPAKDTIDLQASGLAVPAQDGEQALDVPFGSTRAAAEATLGAVLGPVIERSTSPECPAGAMEVTRFEGLMLNFQDDRLVGWFAEQPYLPADTRGAMLAQGGIQMIEDSTLGEEFLIGEREGPAIAGLFDGPGEDAGVSSMWAGANCIYR